MRRKALGGAALAGLWALAGCVATSPRPPAAAPVPRYTLRAGQYWQLNSPAGERFDASGLLLLPNHDLLTVSDRGAGLYRVQFTTNPAAADLVRLPDCFTAEQLAPFAAQKVDRYDCEGIARDAQGRLYLCEEANRWILRFDPKTQKIERLNIDWSPVQRYFHPTDRNASFEGIAIGQGRLYVANERQSGRLIVVDLKTLKVVADFSVRPGGTLARDIHYSDLCWFENALFVLLRENRVILKVDPQTQQVLAEYSYSDLERQLEVVYNTVTANMEGLAVERDYFWLVTDNNGRGRWKNPKDTRPTLFKCPRPDRQ